MAKREKRERGGTSICFDCKKACGGCSWTEYDPAAGKIKWEPVSGWVAERVMYPHTSRWQKPSWRVLKCPEFEPDEPAIIITDRYCEMCGAQIIGEHVGSRCHCFKCVPKYHYYERATGEVKMLQKYKRLLEGVAKNDG